MRAREITRGALVAVGVGCCAAWLGCGSATGSGGAHSGAAVAEGVPAGSLAVATDPASVACVGAGPIESAVPPAVAAARREGLAGLDAGDFVAAQAAFQRALELHPGDLASTAGLIAVDVERKRAQERAQQELSRVEPLAVPRPPFGRFTAATKAPPPAKPAPKLVRTGSSPNKIIDEDRWFERNGLSLPVLGRRAEDVGGRVPGSYRGARLGLALRHADHDVYVYAHLHADTFVAVVDRAGGVVAVIDITSLVVTGFGPPQNVVWAEAEGDTLYVSTHNMHYASESGGRNGFVTAVSLRDGRIVWQSEPVVANAGNFLVAGDHLITGYGFTAEPDHVFVLSRATGEVVSRTPTASSPEIFVEKGGTLFVRTYDTDLTFSFDPPLDAASKPGAASANPVRAPAGAVSLRPSGARPAHPSEAEIVCLRERGILALDRGQAAEADRLLEQARALDPERPSSKALVGAGRFLQAELAKPEAIVLSGVTPVRLARPPFEYTLVRPAPVATGRAPKLVKARESANQITDEARFIAEHRIQPRGVRPSRDDRVAPGDPSAERLAGVPPQYGNAALGLAIRHPDHLVLIYGGRFVAVVRGAEVVRVLDFESYLLPDKVVDEWRQFASEDVTWAEARGGVLFVENGGGSYAKEVFGKKGYLSAIDLSTGELLWRSQPLVANAGGFVLKDGHIISGYGFTAEPDALFVLEQTTGKVVSKVPLKSGPSLIVEQSGQLLVRTYDTDYVFELK